MNGAVQSMLFGFSVLVFSVAVGWIVSSLYLIRESEVGLVEKKVLGGSLPAGRVVAANGEQGLQARTLAPGLHFMPKPFFKVWRIPLTRVPQGFIALITAIDGAPLQIGQLLARTVDGHHNFQDGVAFLSRGGQKGAQVGILTPGQYRINTRLFEVDIAAAIEVPEGRIATVTAIDGAPLPMGQLLGRATAGHSNFQDAVAFLAGGGQKGPQVEILTPGMYYINPRMFGVKLGNAVKVRTGEIGIVEAFDGTELRTEQILGDSLRGHDDFQSAQAFLDAGGQRGPQLDILKPGMYYINPLLFDVTVQDATVINIGEVGVIRSNVGILPPVGEDGRTPDLVDEGYRGVLKTVLEPNTYYLNPIAYVVFPISTLNITIDWSTENRDTPRDSVTVKSRDGFSFPVDVKVVIRVLKEHAPLVVSKIGSIQNAVDRVIHPAIGATFRNNAERCDALDFLNNRSVQQANARDVTTIMLREYGIETVDVLVGNVGIPEELLKTQTDRFLAKEREKTYREQKTAEDTRRELESATALANQQKNIVAAHASVEISKSSAAAMVAAAEGEARQIELRADANSAAYQKLIAEIGREGLIGIEMLKLVRDGQIKITPEVYVSGDSAGPMTALAATMLGGRRQETSIRTSDAPQAA